MNVFGFQRAIIHGSTELRNRIKDHLVARKMRMDSEITKFIDEAGASLDGTKQNDNKALLAKMSKQYESITKMIKVCDAYRSRV